MSISEQQRQENQDRHLGERDPKRPPGLALVVIAFVLLVTLGYIIYPGHWSSQTSSSAGGGEQSATTKPADSPTGK